MSIEADIYWVENIPDIPYLSLALLRKRYVYDRRSPWGLQLRIEFGNNLVARIVEVIERYLIKHAKLITTVSTAMKYEYSYDKQVIVIPNYPEESFASYTRKGRGLREEIGVPDEKKVFIFIGKLTRIEGVDILVETAYRLRNLEQIEIWILGDGPLRNHVIKAEKQTRIIRYFGWIPRRKIGEYIVSADYGLVPRHPNPYSIFYSHEGIHKIGEYFAYGKPVISCGIAPSPYYLNVKPEEFPDTLEKVVLNKITPPPPPRNLFWERISERRILKIIKLLLNY